MPRRLRTRAARRSAAARARRPAPRRRPSPPRRARDGEADARHREPAHAHARAAQEADDLAAVRGPDERAARGVLQVDQRLRRGRQQRDGLGGRQELRAHVRARRRVEPHGVAPRARAGLHPAKKKAQKVLSVCFSKAIFISSTPNGGKAHLSRPPTRRCNFARMTQGFSRASCIAAR